jgi:SAM-dependent methyltransferase
VHGKQKAIREMRRRWDHFAAWHKDPYASVGRVSDSTQLKIGINEIAQTLDLSRASRVLEIGCGTGLLVSAINPLVSLAVGTDFSQEALNLAKVHGAGPRYIAGEATNLPFKNAEFDRVFSYSVFHHIKDINAAVVEALRVCRSKGIVVLGDLPDKRKRYSLYSYYCLTLLKMSFSWPMLFSKLKARMIHGVNWFWIDIAKLQRVLQQLGHTAEVIVPQPHIQFGCKVHTARITVRIQKK